MAPQALGPVYLEDGLAVPLDLVGDVLALLGLQAGTGRGGAGWQ